jgi:hypothetical protein
MGPDFRSILGSLGNRRSSRTGERPTPSDLSGGRDMGGGTSIMLKEISLPICVNGRHWGRFRTVWTPQSGHHIAEVAATS